MRDFAAARRLISLPRLPIAVALVLLAGCAVRAGDEPTGTTSEATTVCATGSTVKGVDVSTFQGAVNWTSAKAAGIDFAFARISDGTANPDDQFKANWQGMKAAGVIRGAYQYWEPADDPTAQANLVASSLSAAGGFEAGDLPIVMDIETSGGASASTIEANMQTWLAAVKAATGKTPIIYTSMGTYPISATTYDTYPLWVANYTSGCPSMPVGWTSWIFWQNADNGSVNGISGGVDTDEYNGTLAQLQAFAGSGGTTSPDGGTGGIYAAQYVSQSWPLASTAMAMTTCQTTPATITFKNTGTLPWDSHTRLATTQPRDRVSDFADSTWISTNRAAAVTGTVPPGGTYDFKFDFHAPPTAGTFQEYFGLVEDGVAWFSDSGQGGPPDNDIEANITVTAGSATCTVDPGVPDGGTGVDAGHPAGDGGTTTGDAGTKGGGGDAGGGGGSSSGAGSSGGAGQGDGGENWAPGKSGGCDVGAGGGGGGGAGGLAGIAGVLVGLATRRRRRASR
jgi:lysozyme